MKASDLVIGNFYIDIERPAGEKLVYTKVLDSTWGPLKGEHVFDSVDSEEENYTGCIGNDNEVAKYIEPFVEPKKKAAKKKVAK